MAMVQLSTWRASVENQPQEGIYGYRWKLVSSPVGLDADSQMASQGLAQKLIGVEVRNVGRLPISIDGAEASMENGASFTETNFPANPPHGARIEPHSSESWWVRWEAVVAMATASAAVKPEWNRPQEVRMVVRPSAGKRKRTKEISMVSPRT